MTVKKIYGFWKYATVLDHEDIDVYLDLTYHIIFK